MGISQVLPEERNGQKLGPRKILNTPVQIPLLMERNGPILSQRFRGHEAGAFDLRRVYNETRLVTTRKELFSS